MVPIPICISLLPTEADTTLFTSKVISPSIKQTLHFYIDTSVTLFPAESSTDTVQLAALIKLGLIEITIKTTVHTLNMHYTSSVNIVKEVPKNEPGGSVPDR